MIEHHLVQFIATDAHNVGNRGFVLKEAYEVISAKFGQEYVEFFQETARKVIEGKDSFVVQPNRVKKKWFGIF